MIRRTHPQNNTQTSRLNVALLQGMCIQGVGFRVSGFGFAIITLVSNTTLVVLSTTIVTVIAIFASIAASAVLPATTLADIVQVP